MFEAVARLPGWTRGLCFCRQVAFVATSRVLPRFRAYAPGLDPDRSVCGVHALDLRSGRVEASIEWPGGNQVFALDWLPGWMTDGFPLTAGAGRAGRARVSTFYSFSTHAKKAAA
jgi:hypothetical protein